MSLTNFILENTQLQRVPFVPELHLYMAAEIAPLWILTQQQLGITEAPPPFWAFAWAGGLALARYLLDHHAEVAGKRVLDFASGSGLCAIAALKAGAAYVRAADIDAFSGAAVALNAQANAVSIDFTARDLLTSAPPSPDDIDVILVGDVCYEQALAARVLAWLQAAHARGTRVLLGDPYRAYLPQDKMRALAAYEVPTSRDLEASTVTKAAVFTI